jgi:Fe-S oxidoreductase
MTKNIVETEGLKMTSQRGAYALLAGLARLYAHGHAHALGYPHARTHAQTCTHRPICNTYCFSTATVVT